MKCVGLLLLSATLSVQAASYVEVVTQTEGKIRQSQIVVDKGRVAMLSGGKTQMVYEEATGQILLFSHKDKSYRVMDSKKLAAMADGLGDLKRQAMAMMENQMQGMSPEQRAQMQKMLGMNTSEEQPAFSFSADGKTAEVHGQRCQWLSQYQGEQLYAQACTAPLKDTAISKQDYQTLSGFFAKAQSMAGSLGVQEMDMALSEYLLKNDKVPLQLKETRDGKQQVHSLKISKREANEQWFSAPRDYQVQSGIF
ncbi:hypothetical protein P2G88_03055 [Aliiglaciecola sp. CAU 1673]|uniref:hypothetical protein n=1 Tax=Aliiglaciecola sp. CAU 1673 TaxID=3032595 RepID=UPI0023DB2E33|nr:hypothetical protein [Aliiglaciecola sp. CAU 1673]MDF2177219.1 hypothetical protein [Aliiglaciecola sp. CAU 1673]